MERIKSLSGYMRIAAFILMGSVGVNYIGDMASPLVPTEGPLIESILVVLHFALVSLVKPSLMIAVLYYVQDLFSYYERGHIFTKGTIRAFKNIAISIVVFSFANPVIFSADGWWVYRSGEELQLDLSFIPDYLPLFIGLFFYIIAYVMELGLELTEQEQLTI